MVHLAVVLLVVGIVASGEYGTATQGVLKPGQSLALDGYTLTNNGLFQTREQNSITTRVRLAVTDHGKHGGNDPRRDPPVHRTPTSAAVGRRG